MKKLAVLLVLIALVLCACGAEKEAAAPLPETSAPTEEAVQTPTEVPEATIPETSVPETTVPEESAAISSGTHLPKEQSGEVKPTEPPIPTEHYYYASGPEPDFTPVVEDRWVPAVKDDWVFYNGKWYNDMQEFLNQRYADQEAGLFPYMTLYKDWIVL